MLPNFINFSSVFLHSSAYFFTAKYICLSVSFIVLLSIFLPLIHLKKYSLLLAFPPPFFLGYISHISSKCFSNSSKDELFSLSCLILFMSAVLTTLFTTLFTPLCTTIYTFKIDSTNFIFIWTSFFSLLVFK